MIYKTEFHEDVAHDYKEAYTWYEKQKEGLGNRFLEAVKRKIEQISERPESFSQKSRKGYREAKVDIFPYLIIYKVYKQTKKIFINSVHHEKKHPKRKFRN